MIDKKAVIIIAFAIMVSVVVLAQIAKPTNNTPALADGDTKEDSDAETKAGVRVVTATNLDAAAPIDSDRLKIRVESAAADFEDWPLILVNAENPMPDNYVPILSKLDNGLEFDARAIEQLRAMLNDARTQGLHPIVVSAYRTNDQQTQLFINKVEELMAQGMHRGQAEAEARKTIAYPGTSEHQLGLAVDIAARDYLFLEEDVANTPEIQWLMQNCSSYGFILRYPKGKEDVTGIIYEPWHFRYVGKSAAQEIMAEGITLEEYVNRRPKPGL